LVLTDNIRVLEADLYEEKAARVTAQVKADVLSWAIRDLKVSADKFTTQIPTLLDKVKHLVVKVVEGLREVRAQEFCLVCTI
jgi:hypothetical protein